MRELGFDEKVGGRLGELLDRNHGRDVSAPL